MNTPTPTLNNPNLKTTPLKRVSQTIYLSENYLLALHALALGGLGDQTVYIRGMPAGPAIGQWTDTLRACGWDIKTGDVWEVTPLKDFPDSLPELNPTDEWQICILAGLLCAFEKWDARLRIPQPPKFLGFLFDSVASGKASEAEPSIEPSGSTEPGEPGSPGSPGSPGEPAESAISTEPEEPAEPQNQLLKIKPESFSNSINLKSKQEPWQKLAYFYGSSRLHGNITLEAMHIGFPGFEAVLSMLGHPLKWERQQTENLSELERRMARLKKGNQREKERLSWSLPFRWKQNTLTLPADPTRCNAYVLAATLCPKMDLTLENVHLHPQNTSFFHALRKMGADIEITHKKEIEGLPRGRVRVRSAELIGKRFGWEHIHGFTRDVGFLMLAASLAQGESIFRDLEFLRQYPKDVLQLLCESLKSAGVQIGEVEDGLVIRGQKEIELSRVDAQGLPELSWTFALLGLAHHQDLEISDLHLWFSPEYSEWLQLLQPNGK